MDKADVADVSAIVGVKDVTSKLKFKMNFSGCIGHMLACKTLSPVALENIAKSRCFSVGLVTRDKWQNDHGDTSHKKMTGDIGRMTMETTVKARRQDQAATNAVEDWDQRHLP